MKGLIIRIALVLKLRAFLFPKNTLSLQRLLFSNRNGPVAGIFPEYLGEVVPRIYIKRIVLGLVKERLVVVNAFSFAIAQHSLQCCCILQHHANVHLEEHHQHNEQGGAEDEDNEPQGCVNISCPTSVDNP